LSDAAAVTKLAVRAQMRRARLQLVGLTLLST